MSYPYPQDRHRDRKEKGDQPYKDDRETMTRTEHDLHAEAIEYGQEHQHETHEERAERLQTDMQTRLTDVTREVEREAGSNASEHEG